MGIKMIYLSPAKLSTLQAIYTLSKAPHVSVSLHEIAKYRGTSKKLISTTKSVLEKCQKFVPCLVFRDNEKWGLTYTGYVLIKEREKNG